MHDFHPVDESKKRYSSVVLHLHSNDESLADLNDEQNQEVGVGHSQELLKQIARQERQYIVLGGDHHIVLCVDSSGRNSLHADLSTGDASHWITPHRVLPGNFLPN